MDAISYKIENFEGPLDLLLALVSKRRVSLAEIRILDIIDQYMKVMGEASGEQLEEASEFVEMAARLVHLKSLYLLPRQEEAQEMERELVGQLVEYSLCKKMAKKFADMRAGLFFAVREPMEPTERDYAVKHKPEELAAAFAAAMGHAARRREPEPEVFDELVSTPVVSVSSKIIFILRNIRRGTLRTLKDLFRGSKSHSESVAIFLGLLELIKVRRVNVAEDGEITYEMRAPRKEHENGI